MLIPLKLAAEACSNGPGPVGSGADEWLLWQLADSAFPTGGFAHSSGLEAAYQHGEIRDRRDFVSFLEASMHQTGQSVLPWVVVGHRSPERLTEWDQRCDAALPNHVANRASRLQGRALLSSSSRIFAIPISRPPCGHYAPIFGAIFRAMELDLGRTSRLFLFGQSRGVISSAVRLGVIGPMEGQTIQFQLTELSERIIGRAWQLDVEDIAMTSPLIELWQSAQDRLYSRLFQS